MNPEFKSPKAFKQAVDKYFKQCDEGTDVQLARKKGPVTVKRAKPYTLPGLAVALGFTGSKALLAVGASDTAYDEVLQYARSKIEDQRMTQGLLGEFDSKLVTLDLINRHDYVTKKDQVQVTATVDFSDAELDQRLAAMEAKVKQIDYQQSSTPLIDCKPQPKLL